MTIDVSRITTRYSKKVTSGTERILKKSIITFGRKLSKHDKISVELIVKALATSQLNMPCITKNVKIWFYWSKKRLCLTKAAKRLLKMFRKNTGGV